MGFLAFKVGKMTAKTPPNKRHTVVTLTTNQLYFIGDCKAIDMQIHSRLTSFTYYNNYL